MNFFLHGLRPILGVVVLTILLPWPVLAIDPPHATANLCAVCHMPHMALGADLSTASGNANLCLSCHQPGGSASTHPFADADQALAWPGVPTNATVAGTSHRWDATAAGHLVFLGGAAIPSTGTLQPMGVHTGAYSKTYTLTITTAGAVGVASFNWIATTPGGGAGNNLLTSTNVLLDQGVSIAFMDGPGTSFQVNDQWNLYVRSDLRQPTNALLLAHMPNGVVSCSTCHDQHSQALTPFDPGAPAYGGSGTGTNRHFMRVNNDQDQMCKDCHAARNVTNAAAGSHPVGIAVPVDSLHKAPSQLPLAKSTATITCETCHQIHYSPGNDADLQRLTNHLAACTDCHLQSDTATPAAHFVSTNNSTLWPGGLYGSLLPARTNLADRGTCANCHAIHGWPNATNTVSRYPHLLADQEENLCFTCHGTNGPAVKQVQADFAKLRHHPVADSEQKPGRTVECTDCHNVHMAQSGALVYGTTATATRNRITNPLKGVTGVAFNYSPLANFQTVSTNLYTPIAKSPGATYEYQICFKCHSSYAWGAGTPPNGLSPNGAAVNPVETDCAQEFSPMNKSGHPIMTGLDNYPNSIAVGGKKGLLATALKPPWNVNIGQQTMTCSDCHNTDAATPAAQGPHGSAAQFMLRGPNAANWPNVTLANRSASWCMNCHNDSAGVGHTAGDHSGRQCYVCHIVIPHGGKMSRLIGSNSGTMPARYAYNNTVSTMGMQSFLKATASGYTENGNCRTSCGHHGSGPINETW